MANAADYSFKILSKDNPDHLKEIKRMYVEGKLKPEENNSFGDGKRTDLGYEIISEKPDLWCLCFAYYPGPSPDSNRVLDAIEWKSKRGIFIDITDCASKLNINEIIPALVTKKNGKTIVLRAWVGNPMTEKFEAVPKSAVNCRDENEDED